MFPGFREGVGDVSRRLFSENRDGDGRLLFRVKGDDGRQRVDAVEVMGDERMFMGIAPASQFF